MAVKTFRNIWGSKLYFGYWLPPFIILTPVIALPHAGMPAHIISQPSGTGDLTKIRVDRICSAITRILISTGTVTRGCLLYSYETKHATKVKTTHGFQLKSGMYVFHAFLRDFPKNASPVLRNQIIDVDGAQMNFNGIYIKRCYKRINWILLRLKKLKMKIILDQFKSTKYPLVICTDID